MYIKNIGAYSDTKQQIIDLSLDEQVKENFLEDGYCSITTTEDTLGNLALPLLKTHTDSNYYLFTTLSLWEQPTEVKNLVFDKGHVFFLELANAMSQAGLNKQNFDVMVGNGCAGASTLSQRACDLLQVEDLNQVTCLIAERNNKDNMRVAEDFSFISSDVACAYDIVRHDGDWKIISTVRTTDSSLISLDVKAQPLKSLVSFAALCREAKRQLESKANIQFENIDYFITENLHSQSLVGLKNALGIDETRCLSASKAMYGHTFNADTMITLGLSEELVEVGQRVLLIDHSNYNVNFTLVERA